MVLLWQTSKVTGPFYAFEFYLNCSLINNQVMRISAIDGNFIEKDERLIFLLFAFLNPLLSPNAIHNSRECFFSGVLFCERCARILRKDPCKRSSKETTNLSVKVTLHTASQSMVLFMSLA